MTRVLLAGSTGVVGRRLIPLLLAGGHAVTAVTRSAARAPVLRAAGAEPVVVDVLHRDALRAAVAAARPDVVLHQLTDLSGGNLEANAELRRTGTRNLVDAAVAAGVRRVVAQSIAWAYRPGDVPAREDEPLDVDAEQPRRTSVLGVVALENAVLEVPEPVVLRYGLLHGPDTWYAPGAARARDAAAGRLRADGSVSSFVHVDDAAAAAVAALDWPVGIVNVCDDEPAAAHEWVPAFCRAVDAPEPEPVAGRDGWARGADNQHARADLGWVPAHGSWRASFATLAQEAAVRA